jgi:hypothetical protein
MRIVKPIFMVNATGAGRTAQKYNRPKQRKGPPGRLLSCQLDDPKHGVVQHPGIHVLKKISPLAAIRR